MDFLTEGEGEKEGKGYLSEPKSPQISLTIYLNNLKHVGFD